MSTESQYTAQEKYRKSKKGKANIKKYELKRKEQLQLYRQQYNKEKREREQHTIRKNILTLKLLNIGANITLNTC